MKSRSYLPQAILVLGASTLCLTLAAPTLGAKGGKGPALPPLLRISQGELRAPEQIHSVDGVLRATLTLRYTQQTLGTGDSAETLFVRTYNNALVGPTLRVRPGDEIRILLKNELPENPPGISAPDSPYGNTGDAVFNTTNLHLHGLHVSPTGNSDNVLLELEPGDSLEYYYQVPLDHPPGTHWYHSHVHGSTALQVSSGVEGMLIVEGGLDDLPSLKDAKQQELVIQQFSYSSCGPRELESAPGTTPPNCLSNGISSPYETCEAFFKDNPDAPKGPFKCVENFDVGFSPLVAGFGKLGNPTTINGQVMPRITMQPGEVQRWRVVHGGVAETINLALVPAPVVRGRSTDDKLRTALRTAPAANLNVVAYDGITTGKLGNVHDTDNEIILQPGYRVDVLAQVTAPGEWLLIDADTADLASLFDAEDVRVLAHVSVNGPPKPMSLPTEAELQALVPYESIQPESISACQSVAFNLTGMAINGVNYYNATEADVRKMPLGAYEEWALLGIRGDHPFHVHVNPFQVVNAPTTPELEGVWKDTLLVTQASGTTATAEDVTRVYTHYEDFLGTFVQHCHILDHEDMGMMQKLEVVPPATGSSGTPGACPAACIPQDSGPDRGKCVTPAAP